MVSAGGQLVLSSALGARAQRGNPLISGGWLRRQVLDVKPGPDDLMEPQNRTGLLAAYGMRAGPISPVWQNLRSRGAICAARIAVKEKSAVLNPQRPAGNRGYFG